VATDTNSIQVQRGPGLDGLASMVADLFDGNLAADPGRASLLTGRTWRTSVLIAEADSEFALVVGDGRLAMTATAGPAELVIAADGDTLIELPDVPLIAGLPDLRRPPGRALVAKILRRQLKVRGLLRHPVLLTRLLRLLTTGS